MTVLLALKTPDAVFAACDCRRYDVRSETVIDPVEKLQAVGDHSVWMIGGVMNAIPELEPTLSKAKDVEELNELMTTAGHEAFDRWSSIAKRDGVDNPGIYYIVAGFDRNGSPHLFSHLFRTGEFKEHTGTQAYLALARTIPLQSVLPKQRFRQTCVARLSSATPGHETSFRLPPTNSP